jgi:hypothetical protein
MGEECLNAARLQSASSYALVGSVSFSLGSLSLGANRAAQTVLALRRAAKRSRSTRLPTTTRAALAAPPK